MKLSRQNLRILLIFQIIINEAESFRGASEN